MADQKHAKQVPSSAKDEQSSDLAAAYSMDRLSTAFENSARRWELIVYPSLFAFIILAAYGFYLIFSLAKDVHYLAISVDTNMTVMASNFQSVAKNMDRLTTNINTMTVTLQGISEDVGTLEPIKTNMENMNSSMAAITAATHNMQTDMRVMNHNVRDVSRPMSVMGNFMPW